MRNHSADLEIERERDGDIAILRPRGEIDLSRAPALRNALMDAVRLRPGRLVVDLQNVSYMDSSGVATFVEALQQMRAVRGRLVLCGLQPKVRSIFEIARLDMVFTIVDDTARARAV